MNNASSVLQFLLDASGSGERAALITITEVIGSGFRSVGSHMAVTENGLQMGSVSGGCVEAALRSEARSVIRDGKARRLRLGPGSPYLDIRLPCGGGLDLLLTPAPPVEDLSRALSLLRVRQPVELRLGMDSMSAAEPAPPRSMTGWDGDVYRVRHDPPMRLCIIGNGAEAEALTRLARVQGAEASVLSPDPMIVERAFGLGAQAHHLEKAGTSLEPLVDYGTAIVMLFHEHAWEIDLLLRALVTDAFFVGAMGSRNTQARRLGELRRRGVSEDALARLVGPVGMIPGARDPETLALSVMAQVVAVYAEATSKLPAGHLPKSSGPELGFMSVAHNTMH
jgi:xanthine dehydrogenase accessory factor